MIASGMSAVVDWLINIYITVPDFQVKATLRVSADPSFVLNRSSLASKIR